jgi:hypothetical protein
VTVEASSSDGGIGSLTAARLVPANTAGAAAVNF